MKLALKCCWMYKIYGSIERPTLGVLRSSLISAMTPGTDIRSSYVCRNDDESPRAGMQSQIEWYQYLSRSLDAALP